MPGKRFFPADLDYSQNKPPGKAKTGQTYKKEHKRDIRKAPMQSRKGIITTIRSL